MLKRLTSLLLMLAMVITMLPVSALAEETGSAETIAQETAAVWLLRKIVFTLFREYKLNFLT